MYVINQEDHFFKILLQKLRGQTEALYILTRCNNTRFEFIFTNLVSAKIIETYSFSHLLTVQPKKCEK